LSVFAHVEGLGDAIETCVADSVLAWRKEFKPGKQTVDTIAEHLYSVETSVSLRPAGVAMITVQVNGRGFLEASTQCFRLQRGRIGRWKVTASSLA
jgi:hypothetical protein